MHIRLIIFAFVYLAAVTIPLAASWWVGAPPRPFVKELASGFGIIAFSIVLAEFFLSGRFKSVSNGIGMDVTMRLHQMMGRTALLLLLLHPFLYGGSPSGGQRPWDPTRELTVTTDFGDLSSGITAFLLLPSLVLFAIYRDQLDYKYETWRWMHGLGSGLIALLLLHHTIHAGRYGSQMPLTLLWQGLTALAVLSLLYVYLVVPVLERSRAWHVSSVEQLSPKQWNVTLTPDRGTGLSYLAGQFVWLNIGNSPFSLRENPFSISSAPAAGPNVSFMIKELGDFTRTIGQIEPGTAAYLDGAYGNLTIEGRTEPGVALIAGGIGIAPMLGILRQMRLTNDKRQVRIVYGNRKMEQIICREELDAEDVCYVLSDPPKYWNGETGLIGPKLLDKLFTQKEIEDWVFVVCGPVAMMDSVEDHLINKGTPTHRILTERFDYD